MFIRLIHIMRISCTCFVVGFCINLCFNLAAAATEITLITEEYKPYQYKDTSGQVVGFGVELVQLVFDEAQVFIQDNQIKMLPWTTGYSTALRVKNTAIFMTVRTEERDSLFKWVGPLAARTMWLYKMRSRADVTVKSLEDAKRYIVGGYKGSADTNYMKQLGFNVLATTSSQTLLTKMLVNGRFDLLSSLELTMISRLSDLNLPYSSVEKTQLLDDRYDYYLALNKETNDDVVERLQSALLSIRSNGRYEQLRDSHLRSSEWQVE